MATEQGTNAMRVPEGYGDTLSLVPGHCPWRHTGIDTLFGVAPVPIKDLPTVCTCGAALAYADEVTFVSQPAVSWPAECRTAYATSLAHSVTSGGTS